MSDLSDAAAATTSTADLSGRQLGGYRLLRRLGRGAMAEVYLAEQTALRRQVAFKVLHASLATDETYVRRFHLEAQAAAALVHANIVQIHEVGCVDGIHFIAQEYVQGVNLQELLQRRGTPKLRLALDVMRQVAAALQKAAEQGIVHRDIKPENIMLASSGEVKVADFGLARLSSSEPSLNLTQIGVTMGTPLYMSPEQVEGRPLDPRSDLYSFGVTSYQMLAGETPFRGETALSVAVQHLKTQPPRLENVRPDLPPALCRIIHKLLAKDPAERYQAARDVLRDLHAVAVDGNITLSNATSTTTAEEVQAWTGDGDATPGGSRIAATQRLAAVMKTSAQPVVRRPPLLLIATLLATAFGLGLVLARAQRPAPLLAATGGEHAVVVEKKGSAEAQYIYALMVDSEDAWKSVSKHYPDNRYYSLRAQQQLARWYLEEDSYGQALALFEKFSAMPDVEQQFQAFGLAGEAVVLALQGKTQQSAERLADLWPLRSKLDSEMRNMVTQLVRRNQRVLTQQSAKKWEEWFAEEKSG